MIPATEQFLNAIRAAGLTPPLSIECDGEIHRFASNGNANDDAGWYLLHDNGIPAGSFGDWRTGVSQNWRADIGRALTPTELAALREKAEADRVGREEAEKTRHEDAARKAKLILRNATGDVALHPYAMMKRLNFGSRVRRGEWPQRDWSDALLIPLYDASGAVQSIEAINEDGTKDFLYGGRKRGCFHPLGRIRGALRIVLTEGLANAAAIAAAADLPAVAAMDAGNLAYVAEIMREVVGADCEIIVAADNDARSDGSANTGVAAAEKAAAAIDATVAVPRIDGKVEPDDYGTTKCDFWDVWAKDGPARIAAIFNAPIFRPPDPTEASATSTTREWPAPEPLPDGLAAVDAFELELLPACIRAWIGDIADRVQCPPDFVAIAAITEMGSILGGKIAIRPQAQTPWSEVSNQWGLLIGRPGVLKSPAIDQALVPLRRLEAVARERFAAEEAAFRADEMAAKLRAKVRARIAEKVLYKDSAANVSKLLVDDDEAGEAPTCKRYTTSDTSYQSLAELVRLNPNGVLVHRDEIVSLLRDLDREENAGARGFYLTGWNGSTSYTVDRIGRGFDLHIPRVCLSMLGGTQPARIAEYVRTATTGGRGDDGLIQRFGLMVWPDVSGEWKNVDRWPDSAAKKAAYDAFSRLDDLDPAAVGALQDTDISGDPEGVPYLRFDDGALSMFVDWRGDLERRLRSGELAPALESHLAKYRKLVPSLALIFHLGDGNAGPVGKESLLRALAWSEYLQSHARRIYGSGPAADAAAARTILARIRKDDLPAEFSSRDVSRPCWAGLADSELVAKGLAILVEFNYLGVVKVETAGRPATRYLVNPRALA